MLRERIRPCHHRGPPSPWFLLLRRAAGAGRGCASGRHRQRVASARSIPRGSWTRSDHAAPLTRVVAGRRDTELRRGPAVRSVGRQPVVGVCVVHAGGGDVEELLTVARRGVGQVDDVEDLWAAEAGDLHGSHEGEARGTLRCGRTADLAGCRSRPPGRRIARCRGTGSAQPTTCTRGAAATGRPPSSPGVSHSQRLRPWEPGALSCRDADVVPVAVARPGCHAWTCWSGTSRLPRSAEGSSPRHCALGSRRRPLGEGQTCGDDPGMAVVE
jgi:hypothetical protein